MASARLRLEALARFDEALRILRDKSRLDRIPVAEKVLQAAQSLYSGAGGLCDIQMTEGRFYEQAATQVADEEGKRALKIAYLRRASHAFARAVEETENPRLKKLARANSSRCEAKALAQEGIELMHDLRIATAREKFARALTIRESTGDEDAQLWLRAAFEQADATQLTVDLADRMLLLKDPEKRTWYRTVRAAYERAIASLIQLHRPDSKSTDFCRAMVALFEFLEDRNPQTLAGWQDARTLFPPEIWEPRSRPRANNRRLFLLVADQLVPEVLRNKDLLLRDLLERKLKSMNEALKPRLAQLIKKFPEARCDTRGRRFNLPRMTLGQLLVQFERHLRIPIPPLVAMANEAWGSKKHDPDEVAVRVRMEEVEVELLGGGLDSQIAEYLRSVDVRIGPLHSPGRT